MYVTRSMTELAEMAKQVPLFGKEKAIDLTGDYFGIYVESNGKIYARRLVKWCYNKDSGKAFFVDCAVTQGFLCQLIYHRLDTQHNY